MNSFKSRLALLLVIVLMLCTSVPVLGGEPSIIALTVGSATGTAGQEIEIPVSIGANSGLTNAIIDIVYDNSKLTPLTYTKGSILSGMTTVNLAYASNKIRFVYSDITKINSSGNFLLLSFKINDAAGAGETPISLQVSQFRTLDSSYNPADISFNAIPGSVNVTSNTNKTTLNIASNSGMPGQNIEIPVSISANSGLTNAIIDIVYDNAKLTPLSYTKGSILSGMTTVNLTYASNKVRFVYSDITKINSSGNLLILSFKINDAATGETPISLQVSQFRTLDSSYNPVDIPYQVNPGVVHITSSNKIIVQSFTLTDAQGGTLTSLKAGSTVYLKADIKNESTVQVNPVGIFAFYDSQKRLVKMKFCNLTAPISANGTGQIYDSFVLPTSVSGCILKAMLFEDLISINQISNCIVVN